MSGTIFVNLPVADLEASKKFYSNIGFDNVPAYSDENAAGMRYSDTIFVMLLTTEFFSTFTNRPVGDINSPISSIYCLTCESTDAVDKIYEAAVANGAIKGKEIPDMGMYVRTFSDLDGHAWEILHMPEPQ
ncbi:VOC family protein [Natronoglycomyces albus]|uniref:Glyoxalase n=1 Tax=Natronoglycomyces albus TaxID=2811108 RepID=A0A895XKU6_9ACTN|nr:VOC family protein [Natronoglycomyces albus]QSB04049.1 glyoxalase [Natronoglycomyces albus]